MIRLHILIHCRNIHYFNIWPGDPSRLSAPIAYLNTWGSPNPPSAQLRLLLLNRLGGTGFWGQPTEPRTAGMTTWLHHEGSFDRPRQGVSLFRGRDRKRGWCCGSQPCSNAKSVFFDWSFAAGSELRARLSTFGEVDFVCWVNVDVTWSPDEVMIGFSIWYVLRTYHQVCIYFVAYLGLYS